MNKWMIWGVKTPIFGRGVRYAVIRIRTNPSVRMGCHEPFVDVGTCQLQWDVALEVNGSMVIGSMGYNLLANLYIWLVNDSKWGQ